MELKKEAKKKKQFIKELQAKIAAGAQQYFPVSSCTTLIQYFVNNLGQKMPGNSFSFQIAALMNRFHLKILRFFPRLESYREIIYRCFSISNFSHKMFIVIFFSKKT